jgi:hypothetical protein
VTVTRRRRNAGPQIQKVAAVGSKSRPRRQDVDTTKQIADINNNPDDLHAYLAVELQRAADEHRFAATDLDAVRLALLGGLITAAQALDHVEESDDFRFLSRLPGDHWGPEWAASARQYHENRKRKEPA